MSLFIASLLVTGRTRAADSLPCLAEGERITLYQSLQSQAYAALDRRQENYEALKSRDEITAYQDRLKAEFVKRLGGFPERGPLHATTTKTIDADGYRVENVIFESRPHHHITANLYLPDGEGPFAAVVVSSGHSRTAKTADYNQRFALMMVRLGMAALCFDPIGQGERSQVLNDRGENLISGTTTEHFLIGIGSTLVGKNTATYRVYDAMRAIDYLAARPEVDATRIGMTGCSGGGTLTSYTMALDDRVAVAAPSCYLTTFRRLIETIGPQDSEQNVYGQLAWGMDQTDYVLMRAPKPTLISSTTQDFFDIHGSWDNFRQAKRIYGRLGVPERVDLVEIEGKHGVTPQNLATIGHWMQRWLSGKDEPVPAVELEVRAAEELRCTERGQVLLLQDEASVYDLNHATAQTLAQNRQQQMGSIRESVWRDRIAERIGVATNPNNPTFRSVTTQQRDGYEIEAAILTTEATTPLPINVFKPADSWSGAVYVCLHDAGKQGAVELALPLVRRGHRVITVDLRGQGETASGESSAPLGDWKTFYLAYLLEQSIVGIRTADTLAVTRHVRDSLPDASLHLLAGGQSGIVALHAAALAPDWYESVTLRDSPRDWSSDVGTHQPSTHLDHTVHAALELYDLPDLKRLATGAKVQYDEAQRE